jgi:hypothetical protein
MTIITVPSTKMNRYNTTNERIEKGSISTFLMMEEPVVENPEVDSKNASINEGIVLKIRMISKGFISFMFRLKYFEDTNIVRINFVPVLLSSSSRQYHIE